MIKRSFFSVIVVLLVMVEAYALDIEPPVGYEDFVFTIDSTLVGGANPTPSFPIPIADGEDYNYTVECDDANPGTNATNATGVTGEHWCEYATEGTYRIRISGTFPRIYFYDEGGAPYAPRLLSVDQWGTTAWTSMANAFRGCTNMQINANASPDLSNVTDMSYMFREATSFTGNGSIKFWNTSHVLYMSEMFRHARNFNQDIGDWNTSQVQYMDSMFIGAYNFNQDIGDWNTSKVTSMNSMFAAAITFNQDIGDWDTSSVKHMHGMFFNAIAFNQNLASWNVEKVTSMHDMFNHVTLDTRNYDAILISWDTQNVKNGVNFHAGNSHYCHAASERAHLVSANDWNITDAGLDCTGLKDFIITVKTDNNGTSSDTQFTIPTTGSGYNYNVDCDNDGSNEATAQTGDYTCNYATAGTYTIRIKDNEGDDTGFPRIYFNNDGDRKKIIDINQWGTVKWTSMTMAFTGCLNLDVKATDIPDLSDTTSLFRMFDHASSLVGLSANWAWDTSRVTNMYGMFLSANNFNQDIGDWNTSKVTNMYLMFGNATAFNQDISMWDTSKVYNMKHMFYNASSFNQDIGDWNVSSLEQAKLMLDYSGMSTANYDALLIGWNAQDLKSDVNLSARGIHYCNGESARENMIASDGWNIIDGGKECVNPDYKPILTVYGGIVSGAGAHVFSFDTKVRDLSTDSNYNTTNPLKIIIPKNTALSLTFNPATTMFKGNAVDNSSWSFDDSDAFDYVMTYIGDGIPAGGSRFSLEGIFNVEEGEIGKFFLETTIQSSTGGDNNSDNNSDRETLEKRL